MAMFESRAAAANAASNVAGGQIIRSTSGDNATAPAMILSSSPTDALTPFIFQLPATSGRRAPCDMVPPVRQCHEAVSKPAGTAPDRPELRRSPPLLMIRALDYAGLGGSGC